MAFSQGNSKHIQTSKGRSNRPGLRLGQIIEASDPSSATPYRAKITGISISVAEAMIETNLTMEQPR